MPRKAKKGATILDIASKLGVSAMTVSRALTDSPEVSQKTKEKVLRCANALGYQPNRWARSLVTRRSSIIGVIIPEIAHSFFAEVVQGVEDAVEKAGYDILLGHSRGDPVREQAEIQTLVGSRVDGLIIASTLPERSPAPMLKLANQNIPLVLVDRFFPKYEFPSVRVDDVKVGRMATEFLIDLGHRDIAHIRGPLFSPSSLRYEGFLAVMKARRIAVNRNWVETGGFDIQGGREAMMRILHSGRAPTAVFAGNDPMAMGAVYACLDAGLRVPGDVSIIGAGNIEGAYHPNPFLTTIDWPREDLGRAAGEILLALIDKPEHPIRAKVYEPALLVRQSTQSLQP